MGKNSLSKFTKEAQFQLAKHSPEILIGIGITGWITTTVLAVKATPKALAICDEVRREKEEPTKLDYVKATWKCYIPAAITGITSTACLIGANSVHAKRNAVLATAYKISETALADYRDKVVETIGEKKEQAIKDKVAKDKLEKRPVTTNEVIITEKGNTLCMDAFSGRFFKSDRDMIVRAINELNRLNVVYGYVSLNEFYSELNLAPIEIGDHLGWKIDDREIKPDFTSGLADDGTPCLVVSFNTPPRYKFDTVS